MTVTATVFHSKVFDAAQGIQLPAARREARRVGVRGRVDDGLCTRFTLDD